MSRRRITGSLVAAVLVLTLAAGCSGSDSSDAKDADDKTTTTVKGSGTSTTTSDTGDDGSTTTTEAEGEGEGDSSTPSGDGGDIELTGDFCEKARQLQDEDIFDEATTDTSPDGLLEALKVRLRKVTSVYDQMAEGAPDEVADALALLAKSASESYDAVKDLDSYEEAAAVQAELSEAVESDQLRTASEQIATYLEDSCGITQP